MKRMKTVYEMNKLNGARNKYKEQSIMTSNPGDLVTILYEAAIRNIKSARGAIEKKDYELSNTNIKKSQDIMDELIKGLDFSYDLSFDLLKLYEFITMELVEANISKSDDRLKDVEELISEMCNTWKEAVIVSKKESLSG